jgi:endonuclease/exonuclease/phosphatase (EEP) superfamily protein YafD
MDTWEAKEADYAHRKALKMQAKRNSKNASKAAAKQSRTRFQDHTFNRAEAPTGCIRTEETRGHLKNGRSVPVVVYHAMFGTERKPCVSREQAEAWVEGRRKRWVETTGKQNGRRAMTAALRKAATLIQQAMEQHGWTADEFECEDILDAAAQLEHIANQTAKR